MYGQLLYVATSLWSWRDWFVFAIQSRINRQGHGRTKCVMKWKVKVALLRVILQLNKVEKNEVK